MRTKHRRFLTWLLTATILSFGFANLAPLSPVSAQDPVTGAFRAAVTDSATGAPVAGATVLFINRLTESPVARRTNQQGEAFQGLLQPGIYTIRVTAPGYRTAERDQRLVATRTNDVIPVPIRLERESAEQPTPTPAEEVSQSRPAETPKATPPPSGQVAKAQPEKRSSPGPSATPAQGDDPDPLAADINRTDGRRGGSFNEEEVSTLPLGATTVVRTFDELALLLPGVAQPPQTQGEVAGPGVGAGVGSAGQFAVNGLRSRANNFTVDGSDNNDEDIGVRRQGFLSLVPQPVESVQEYNVITLLAPAQFGRNIGAQVNAISRSGGSRTHGTVYGFLNASRLNAPNFFDTTSGDTTIPLTARPLGGPAREVRIDGRPATVTNSAGDKDSFTLGQIGFVLGGPVVLGEGPPPAAPRWFYFVSGERQILNATKEENFSVPTVDERGLFGSGATGTGFSFPTSVTGDAVFSLFPFPNNPNGVYGRNTLTRELPASGDGTVLSGKIDGNFGALGRQHQFTARYNFTDDNRIVPVTGGALFSSLRPRVQTQNLSTFLNTRLSGESVSRPVFNQLRLSYGRTRLNFAEVRDTEFLIPSQAANTLPAGDRAFLLNARVLFNNTLGDSFVDYRTTPFTTEQLINAFFFLPGNGRLAPVGQLNIAGYSPVGVDVFNFPQRRVNNTYQLADTVTVSAARHSIAFGTDLRRTELNSELPRNFRPLVTFTGFEFDEFLFAPTDLAATGSPSGVFQTLTRGNDSAINLRYYQLNFFGQDEWRVRPNLTLTFGLRYEYNTPPSETNDRIESAFGVTPPPELAGLSRFVDGRSRIFDADENNFGPRVGIAFSPRAFGESGTVIRAGFGVYYDQALGAVVSQSRGVFPNFLTVNFAGGLPDADSGLRTGLFLPSAAFLGCPVVGVNPLLSSNTLNRLNPAVPFNCFTQATESFFPGGFQFTLPQRQLEMPEAYHWAATVEQQLGRSTVLSVGYVGTRGRHLLRQTTPNLGPNAIVVPFDFDVNDDGTPIFFVDSFQPGVLTAAGERPVAGAGAVTIYTSDANSRYDALQVQMRGRFARGLQYQAAYTFSKAEDDASDIFDLAGSPALPQDSSSFAGERAPSNFDVRHRFAYNVTYRLPSMRGSGDFARALFGGLELASTGQFQTGQPFTVNSIYDRNLDGNLTDRLNSTGGLRLTGDRQRPIQLTTTNTFSMLAPLGGNGALPRNSFRASNLMLFNIAVVKNIALTESQRLTFRMEVFNLTDRANFGIPVRFLEAPGFGTATDTVTPGRRIQFALKYNF